MRCALGYARSSRQTVATLVATSLENGSPGTGAHTVAEAMLLRTTTVVRLVGALHAALLEPLNGGHQHSSKVTPRVPQNTGWSWASRQDYGLATAEGNREVLTMRAKAGREVAVPEVCAHLLACPI